jgi:hypothetical protein
MKFAKIQTRLSPSFDAFYPDFFSRLSLRGSFFRGGFFPRRGGEKERAPKETKHL